jgi:hypothetical protein
LAVPTSHNTLSHKSSLKNPWLLMPSAVIAAICLLPFLLFGMLIGSRILMIVAGPVNIWNTTWRTPPVADLAGHYSLSEGNLAARIPPGAVVSRRSGFRLHRDHRAEITDLPDFDGSGERARCNYNGTGTWSTYESGGVQIILNIDRPLPSTVTHQLSCGPASLGLFHLLGHSPPYRIWYNIGDPDNGMGLLYSRQER